MLDSMKKGGGKKKVKAEIVAYKKKEMPAKVLVKAPSKEEVESKIGRIKQMAEEAEDVRIGERDFGSSYKNLGLKGTRQVQVGKEGSASIKAKYKNLEGDEEVSRIPDSDMLQVKKLGMAAQSDEPTFKESIKERISRLDSEKKAALKSKGLEILRKAKLMDQMKKDYPSSFPKNK
jgi:hypothetical protein